MAHLKNVSNLFEWLRKDTYTREIVGSNPNAIVH